MAWPVEEYAEDAEEEEAEGDGDRDPDPLGEVELGLAREQTHAQSDASGDAQPQQNGLQVVVAGDGAHHVWEGQCEQQQQHHVRWVLPTPPTHNTPMPTYTYTRRSPARYAPGYFPPSIENASSSVKRILLRI